MGVPGMRAKIDRHHQLESDLDALRFFRDLGKEEYSEAAEDAILDEMEHVWYELSADDRQVLETERAARNPLALPRAPESGDSETIDVANDDFQRRGLPPRLLVAKR